jgi:photosystem II stability/assembly factor-like uncharacterized protein
MLVPALLLVCITAHAQNVAPLRYQDLKWRCIGPFRGGRTVGAAGIPGHPNEFLSGVNDGGVWKTDDFGQTWKPIFDSVDTGSVGALAVAPSAPDTIYVGSGEGLQRPDLSTGDGMYKSTDGGKTWAHLGLKDGQQIASIAIDPQNPDRVFVAVLGHPYGANEERGVFRTTDGGQTWQKVLYKDADTGAVALAFDPSNAQTVYADLWAARQAPWENGEWQGPGSGLYKSTDGGDTWKPLTNGLPTFKEGLGRIGFSVAPSNPNLIFATVDANKGGIYKSEDAGESWKLINPEARLWGRGSDFAEIRVDPKDPDTLYIANTSTYKSTDGGKNFVAWKGAPGGDDYHTVWVNPQNSQIIMLACDQGATITVNGGKTWSSWYNQPTAQFYHVITDNQFPYWVYGGQQESGSAAICSRGNDGEVTFREWHPVGAEEYGYIAPDPLNPKIIFGGKVSKFDRVTGQVQDVAPTGNYRFLRTAPLLFSPVDPHTLYLGGNVLLKTTDGANSWSVISPDLTREAPDVPDSVGVYKAQTPKVERRGVIYAVAPSYRDANVIWAGTDDGLVHVTRDGGKSWQNVTPFGLTSWSKVSIIDAGHFDSQTAYVAVNRIRLGDMRPYIYATHDGGKTWSKIVVGLPDNAPINTIREDPQVQGLLYCGSETAVYFSEDDGANWNPLRLNMPCSSIRDLVVHGDDLVVATHGRSFWILDDITPLRQLSAVALVKPETAYRYRRDTNSDTPLPPEVPAGLNPPDGAILDYYLDSDQTSVKIQIFDKDNHLVRSFSSDDKAPNFSEHDLEVPMYWVRPFTKPATTRGHHRFVWDLYWQPLSFAPFFPISAIYQDTPSAATSPLAGPGAYMVKLVVGGQTYSAPLLLKLDPRIKTPENGIKRQTEMALDCYQMAQDLQRRAASAGENVRRRRRFGPRGGEATFSSLSSDFSGLMGEVDSADMAPTSMMEAEYKDLKEKAAKLIAGK